MVPAASNTKSIDLIKDQGTPLVVVDRSVPRDNVDIVRGDSEGGAFELTKFLINLGHNRIAIISGPKIVSTAEDRVKGYVRAMRENGLENFIKYSYGRFTQESGIEQTQCIFGEQPKPTAIFCPPTT